MRPCKSHTSFLAAALVLGAILAGCAATDRRLAEDQRSCESMGHAAGTTGFRQCMADLDDRRCMRGGPRSGNKHVVTTDCTKLN